MKCICQADHTGENIDINPDCLIHNAPEPPDGYDNFSPSLEDSMSHTDPTSAFFAFGG